MQRHVHVHAGRQHSSYKIALNTHYWRRRKKALFALCISSDLVPRNIELAIHVTKDDMDDREAWFFTGNNAHKHIYIINFYIYTYSPIKLTEPNSRWQNRVLPLSQDNSISRVILKQNILSLTKLYYREKVQQPSLEQTSILWKYISWNTSFVL